MHLSLASRGGYAALTTVMIALGISFAVVGSFSFFTLNEVRINRAFTKAIEARLAAESGIEDMVYRLVSGKQTPASETLVVGNAVTETTIVQSGSQRIIRAEGRREDYHQNMETRVDVTTEDASFFYGVQVDAGGVAMGNGAQVNGNIFSNGSVSGGRATGDVVVAGGLAETPSVEWPVGCAASCGNADHSFATASSNKDIAQSFLASATGHLPKVSVFLGKSGTPTGDLDVRITADVSGRPNTSAISNGNAVILRSSVGAAPSWIDATFATAPAVTKGTKYWIVLDYGAHSATNHWNWRKDNTDGYAGQTGKYTASWSAGSPTWTDVGGDLVFRLWIGGANTSLANATVNGTARAPVLTNVSAGGSPCPNPSCIVANDPPQALPISDGMIQNWKDAAGCPMCQTITGDYTISNGESASLGPAKITGKLKVDNGGTLTLTGVVWAVDDIDISNNAIVRLSTGYGARSGVLLSDNKIKVSNGTSFSGSGQSGSHLMLLSVKNSLAEEIMSVDNNSLGVIYYAGKGRIKFSNNAAAKEAVAYGITMDNNAEITYESGLADTHFSSGPSGGYDIKHWKKVE